MRFPTETGAEAITRLRRVEGQIRGVQRLIEEGAECREIVTQLAAAKGALDRVGFKPMAAALANQDRDTDGDELETVPQAELSMPTLASNRPAATPDYGRCPCSLVGMALRRSAFVSRASGFGRRRLPLSAL